jgi:phosphatidate cytidylyltransferase
MPHQLAKRVWVAAIGIPTAIAAIYLGGWILVGLLAGLGVLGTHEFRRLVHSKESFPALPSYLGAALFPILVYLSLPQGGGLEFRIVVVISALWLIAASGWASLGRAPEQGPSRAAALALAAALYAGGLPSLILYLRYPRGEASALEATALALLPLVLTWLCDTLAMAGGAWFKGPKMAPRFSPGKTWSGALSGAIGAVAGSLAYGYWVLAPLGVSLSAGELWGCGVLAGTLGQLGDLAESSWKREAGVKESGAFFPGHGGVLDRLDSLYWNIPAVTLVLLSGGTV